MKKRLILILLAIVMVFGLVSCGNKENNNEQDSDTSNVGETDSDNGENVTLFCGAENDYRIVYSADAGDAVKNQV